MFLNLYIYIYIYIYTFISEDIIQYFYILLFIMYKL